MWMITATQWSLSMAKKIRGLIIMRTVNFCRRISVAEKIALDKWARRLEAEEMVIHQDGTVSLYCRYGIICENYTPSARELRRKECD